MSKELIKITEHEGKQAVSARDLHQYLGSRRQFADWMKDRIAKYGLIENQDYVSFHENVKRGKGATTLIEYILSLDCAKELAMVEGNSRGKAARLYFIECEKKLKEVIKPLSQIEIIAQSAQILLEQEKRISTVEEKINLIEARTTTRPDYFTVAGYASLHKTPVNIRQAASIGRQASDLCKKTMQPIDSCFDPRFGKVNMYPTNVLDVIFSRPIN